VKSERKSTTSSLLELVVIVVTAIGLALLIQAFVVKPFRIPTGSMIPTLAIGQRVLVDRIGTHFHDPEVGDIVVFHPPKGADENAGNGKCADPRQGGSEGDGPDAQRPQPCGKAGVENTSTNFVKRVVGGPGDRIAIVDGHVIRNGVREKDSYIQPCAPGTPTCNFRRPIVIPPGEYFMMGDNRDESLDSRFWGPVPKSWIIGGAFATYWPPSRIGFL
jgi:signal peptidase I